MRKFLAISILIVCFLGISGVAKAESWSDDFNDGIFNSALWGGYLHPGESNLVESNRVLNFNALPSSLPLNNNFAVYGTNMVVDFTKNFKFGVDFNNSYSGQHSGGLNIGLARVNGQGSIFDLNANVFSADATAITGGGQKFFRAEINDGHNSSWSSQGNRNVDTGSLFIEYLTAGDTLKFYALDLAHNSLGVGEYQGFTNTYGRDPMHVFIGGWAGNDAQFSANLDNFQGTVTPEPISSALFLLGGGALAFIGRKRKK